MKKVYILLASLILVNSLAFGEEDISTGENSNVEISQEVSAQNVGTELSRGDSFMVSIGMADSSIVPGGEVGGSGQTAVAVSTGSSLASQGTNPGHTPYVFTN